MFWPPELMQRQGPQVLSLSSCSLSYADMNPRAETDQQRTQCAACNTTVNNYNADAATCTPCGGFSQAPCTAPGALLPSELWLLRVASSRSERLMVSELARQPPRMAMALKQACSLRS
jgi:hypothetical protein